MPVHVTYILVVVRPENRERVQRLLEAVAQDAVRMNEPSNDQGTVFDN